jgi:hypothetical protein
MLELVIWIFESQTLFCIYRCHIASLPCLLHQPPPPSEPSCRRLLRCGDFVWSKATKAPRPVIAKLFIAFSTATILCSKVTVPIVVAVAAIRAARETERFVKSEPRKSMSRSTKAGGEGHIFSLRGVDSYLVKEIQRLIGVAGLETLSIKHIEKKVDIERELYKLFHGDFDDNTTDEMDAASLKDSMVVKFFEGRDQFAAATAVEEWVRHDGSKEERRHLVPGLIQNFDCFVNRTGIVLDNTFTKTSRRWTLSLALLSSKNLHPQKSSGQQRHISGANLYRLANQAIVMCQEAVRMGADFLINGRDLPEGKTRKDYFRYVLIKMYRKYGPYGENSLWPNSPPPVWWHFKGWMAFYLLGPMADPAIQCRLFVPSACTIPGTLSHSSIAVATSRRCRPFC